MKSKEAILKPYGVPIEKLKNKKGTLRKGFIRFKIAFNLTQIDQEFPHLLSTVMNSFLILTGE